MLASTCVLSAPRSIGLGTLHMRINHLAAGAALLASLASTPALAQASATQSTTGTTTIVRAITLAKNSDLAFGRVVRPSSGTSTVTINEGTGNRTLSGGDGVLLSSTVSRATYTVGGEGAQGFDINVPSSFSMTRSGGTETITVNLAKTATSDTLSGTLAAAGSATFGVGGNFDVASSTVPGAYSGTFNVTVQYN
jgi:hypothetical protein